MRVLLRWRLPVLLLLKMVVLLVLVLVGLLGLQAQPVATESECMKEGVECVGSPVDALLDVDGNGTGSEISTEQSEKPPGVAGLTLEECKARLDDRQQGFYEFSAALDKTRQETLARVQTSLVAAESSTQGILNRQTGYSAELIEVKKLIDGSLARAQTLLSWDKDELTVRTQLRSLFDELEKEVLLDSERISNVSRSLRDAVKEMQVTHDKTSQILTKVADAETATYVWAYNATQEVNTHARRVAAMKEEVLVRYEQVQNKQTITESLKQIVTELINKHPDAKTEAHKLLNDEDALNAAIAALIPPEQTTEDRAANIASMTQSMNSGSSGTGGPTSSDTVSLSF